MRNKIDPGPPQQQNIYDLIGREKHLGVKGRGKRIPLNLGEALEALEKDDVIREVLPGRMYSVFMHYKTDEWERYMAHVSDWEFERYLHMLP
jgi:glutamine synthetase